MDIDASKGGLFNDGRQLRTWIGRPTTQMAELVRLAFGVIVERLLRNQAACGTAFAI